MFESSKSSFIKDFLRFIIISAIIIIPIRTWVAQPFIVRGASMEPTFDDGQYLIVDELSYNFKTPERGEVIVFRFPEDTSKFFIKRIIGLPGETIEIKNNGVYLVKDGKREEMIEPYLSEELTTPDGTITLGPDEYFILGDNRLFSSDSRKWGTLKRNLIIGRAITRLWPLNRMGVFPGFYKIDLKNAETG